MTDAEIDRVAGFGAHEVRTWVAAARRRAEDGRVRARSCATTIWCRSGSPAWASWSARPDDRHRSASTGTVRLGRRRDLLAPLRPAGPYAGPDRARAVVFLLRLDRPGFATGRGSRGAGDRHARLRPIELEPDARLQARNAVGRRRHPARCLRLAPGRTDRPFVRRPRGARHRQDGSRTCRRRWCWSTSRPTSHAAGRRHTAERIGGQPDVFASVDEALAYHGHENVAAASPLRDCAIEAFLKPVDGGYQLRRDLSFRDNFKKALDTGQSAPVPAFLWPMLSDLKIPALVIRGDRSPICSTRRRWKRRGRPVRASPALSLPAATISPATIPDGLVSAIRAFLD